MAFFLISTLFLSSCVPDYYSGTVQREEKSFLRFIGNTENVTVSIDSGKSFNLRKEHGSTPITSGWQSGLRYNIYEIPHGKHKLKIYRNNTLIVNRIIFIEDHATMEISIP